MLLHGRNAEKGRRVQKEIREKCFPSRIATMSSIAHRNERNVDIVNCDAFALCSVLKQKFDRAVVPTPYGKDEILDAISPIVKSGGAIHFYTFKRRHQIEDIIREFEDGGLEVEVSPPVRKRRSGREPVGLRPGEIVKNRTATRCNYFLSMSAIFLASGELIVRD